MVLETTLIQFLNCCDMLSLIHVLEIIRNALLCIAFVILVNTFCVWNPRQARHKGNENEQENDMKLIKYCVENNSLVSQ